MKKRIIALILVVVMGVLALCSCGEYDYSDAKLEKFTSVDAAALIAALGNLQIADEDEFSADSEARRKEISDIILRSLYNADNADDTEYKEGAPDYADVLHFSYYAKVEVDGETHIINIPKTSGKTDYYLLPANKDSVQFGLYDNEDNDFDKAIEEAFNGLDITDLAFSVKTVDDDGNAIKVAAGDNIIVSFTYKNIEGENKTVNSVYLAVSNSEPAAPEVTDTDEALESLEDLKFLDKFLFDLVGSAVGSEIKDKTFEYTVSTDGEEATTVSYTNVTVNYVTEGDYIPVDVTYPVSNTDKYEDIFGNEVSFSGTKVTYNIFPVHYTKVDYIDTTDLEGDELSAADIANAKTLLTVFYGSASIQEIVDESGATTGNVGALDIFSSEVYKNASEKTFKELMEEFVTLQKDYETAKAAYDKALDTFEKAETALKDAQKKYDDAKKTYDDAVLVLASYKAAKDNVDKAQADVDLAQADVDAAQAAYDAFMAENPDATEGDQKDYLDAIENANTVLENQNTVLQSAKEAFKAAGSEVGENYATGVEPEDYTDEKAQEKIDGAEEYLEQSRESLYGEAYDPESGEEEDKTDGIEGELAEAIDDYKAACEVLYAHKDEDGDCECDLCGETLNDRHVDTDANCECDQCGAALDDHVDEDKNCECDQCGEALNDHVDETEPKDCKCDQCGADMPHVDEDENGVCDVCNGEYTAAETDDEDAEEEKETKSAELALAEAKAARDKILNEELFEVESAEEGAEPVASVIMTQFNESIYDLFEESYYESIHAKVIQEAYNVIMNSITVNRDKLPKKAVNEMYDKLYEGYKYTFFASADTAGSTYDQYGGKFDQYLMTKYGVSKMKYAKDAIKEEAKSYVEEIVKIYRAAQVLGLVYTDEEFEADYAANYNENMANLCKMYPEWFGNYMTEQELHIAKQTEKLFNAVFAVKTDENGEKVVDRTTNIFAYERLAYTLK